MTIRALAAAALLAATVAVPVFAGTAFADSPTACHSDTTQTRNYTHGDPRTGLPSRDGYYYLDVRYGPGCGVGADGLVHLIGHVHALQILPSNKPGNFTGAYAPDGTHHAVYWLEYHGGDNEYTLGLTDASPAVTTPDHLDQPCYPGSKKKPEVCQDGPGTSALTLRYDGPDVFGLAKGGDARFRIANESGFLITDFAQLDVVACSTCTAPIVG